MAEGSTRPTNQSPSHIHVNRGFQYEESESEGSTDLSDALSASSDENDFNPEWVDNVTSNGELFYIESSPVKSGGNAFNGSTSSERTPTKVKSRARDKILKWVQKEDENNSLRNGNLERQEVISKVTFQASPNGDVKEVVLDVDPRRHNYGRRASLCEVLFGIIPSDFDESLKSGDGSNSKVMVQGFVPNGEALKSGIIKIGDWLRKVDGVEVSLENLTLVLGSISTPRKVKLEVQRFAGDAGENLWKFRENPLYVNEIVIENKLNSNVFNHVPHILLYLGDGSSGDGDEDYVIYKYPRDMSSLFSLNGMFITLNHMVTDVTSHPPLASSVVVDEQVVHVGYFQEERQLLVLALPASSVSRLEIQHLVGSLGRLLRWQYETLKRAFTEKENQDRLDKLFNQFFFHILSPITNSNESSSQFLSLKNCFGAVPWLPLSSDLQIHLDSILSEFESGDFGDMSEAYYDMQRLYTILGSCFFHKGVLCASHLPKEDLLDIYWYVFYHKLLKITTSEEVAQIIIWREVFPSRRRGNSQTLRNTVYREWFGRYFLLIVALKSSLFCTLLEAGGCSLKAEGHPPPDPFYVDQARAVLLKMDDMTLTSQIDKCVENKMVPEIVCADWFLSKSKQFKKPASKESNISRSSSLQALSRKNGLGLHSSSHSSLNASVQWLKNDSGAKKKQEVTSILKKRSGTDSEKEHLIAPSSPPDFEADGDAGTHDDGHPASGIYDSGCQTSASSNSDADSRASYDTEIYRMKSERIFASAYDLQNVRKCLDELQEDSLDGSSLKLTSGCENVLFQYISLDVAEGVLVTPTEQSQQWLQGAVHKEIVRQFQKCVVDIHHVLHSTQKSKESLSNREQSQFSLEQNLAPVKEYGVLFNSCPQPANNNTKKTQPSIDYWVVGRLFQKPEPKEVYVCFQDSASQNAVELAFKLSFGIVI